jgi:hypothetical protein
LKEELVRLPIKFNSAGWPAGIRRLLRGSHDPRALLSEVSDAAAFASAVSILKFGATFKMTHGGRYPRTIAQMADIRFDAPPVILDVGASDGSTSLDVMAALEFQTFYCTDLNIECRVVQRGGWTYFFSPDGVPSVAASGTWVVYNDWKQAIAPFGFAAREVFRKAPELSADARRIELLNPALKQRLGERVRTQRHNVLDPWPGENCDLVIAANILNRTYFSDSQLQQIVRNLRIALKPRGWIALIDNRDHEASSLVSVTVEGARVHARVGAGSEIEGLAMRALADE